MQAQSLRINPLHLMLPATIMCSYSFSSPVGTPPNTIIRLQAHVPLKTLLIIGVVVSIYTYLIVIGTMPAWIELTYESQAFPAWARSKDDEAMNCTKYIENLNEYLSNTY